MEVILPPASGTRTLTIGMQQKGSVLERKISYKYIRSTALNPGVGLNILYRISYEKKPLVLTQGREGMADSVNADV